MNNQSTAARMWAEVAPTNERPQATFTFPNGRSVKLQPLGEVILTGLLSDVGKPQAPTREITMAGGAKQNLTRKDDEPFLSEEEVDAIKNPQRREEERAYRQYRLALQEWNMRKGLIFARTLFLLGVEDGPTADESEIWLAVGFTDPYDIKYMWLALQCRDMDVWNNFIEAMLSYSMPTEEGMAEMKELFRSGVAGESPPSVGAGGGVGSTQPAAEPEPTNSQEPPGDQT